MTYGVAPLLRRGITGRGETVAIFALAQTPASHGSVTDIRKDLAYFDKMFALPPARLKVVNVAKSKTPYLAGSEELGDTEMVHAFAPGAALDVILMPKDIATSLPGAIAAITKTIQEGVALHAGVVSISFSTGEHSLTRTEAAAMHKALEQARDLPPRLPRRGHRRQLGADARRRLHRLQRRTRLGPRHRPGQPRRPVPRPPARPHRPLTR